MPAVECPTCEKPLRVPEESAGQTARCPHCSQVFVVPSTQPEDLNAGVPPRESPAERAAETAAPPGGAAPVVECVGCQSQLRLPAGFQAGKIRCPHCGTVQSMARAPKGSGDESDLGKSATIRTAASPPTPMAAGGHTPAATSPASAGQRWRGSPDTAGVEPTPVDTAAGADDESAGGERIVKRPPPLTGPVEMPVDAEAVQDHPWYLKAAEGQTYGPVPRSELVTWVSQGRVSPNCMVCREGDDTWRWARDEFPAIASHALVTATHTCPHCGGPVDAASGQCGRCHAPVPSMPGYGGIPSDRAALEGITVPLLVSAISNIVFAIIWGFSCWGIVFAAPLIVLCVFEFILYSQAAQIDRPQLATRAQAIAIFELIVGLLNMVALICGIIILVNCSKLKQGHI